MGCCVQNADVERSPHVQDRQPSSRTRSRRPAELRDGASWLLLARPCLHPSWRGPVALRARARGRGRSPQPEQRVRVSAGSCGRSWWEWQRTQRPSPLLCGRPILPSKKPHVIGESAPFPFSAHGALPPVFASMRQRCAKQTKKQAQRLCAHRQTPRSSRSTSCCRPRGTRVAPCSPAAGGSGQPEHRRRPSEPRRTEQLSQQ